MSFKLATLSAAVAALPFSVLAAEDAVALPEVVVKAAKSDAAPVSPSESRLDAAALQGLRPATSDTASLLRDVPGVSLTGAGGVSSLPSIRGLADDRLRIKVDGMDLIAACPNHMNSPLSYIDPGAVATAKVYSGASPVSIGGDSIGGSIVVESAEPEFTKSGQGPLLKGEAGLFYRSNGNAFGGHLSATVASEQLSFNYTGSSAQSDNYRAGGDFKTYAFTGRAGHLLDRDEVGSTAYKAVNQSVTLAWKGDTDLVEFKYGRQHIPFENYPNQRMDMTDNVSDQFSLAYTGKQAWGTLKARAYYEHTQHEMDFGEDKRFWYGSASGGSGAQNGTPCSPISSSCAEGMPMYTDGKNTGVSLGADIVLNARDLLKVGAEFQAYRLDDWWPPSGAGMWPDTFWNIRDGERDRYAVFGEWEARHSAQWTSVLGLRHETVKMDAGDVNGYCTSGMCMGSQLADAAAFNGQSRDKTDRNWDLSALARYTPDATQTFEAGIAQKTRSPSLYERYTWSTWSMAAVMNNFVGDGNGYVGDIDLKPEVAHTLSIAADWHDAGAKTWSLRVSPFYSHVRDFIDARCLPGTTCTPDKFNVLQYVNQSARLYGADLSGKALVARTQGYGDFTLSGVVNYVRGENRDTGDDLYNIMPLNARLTLTQSIGRWRNALESEWVARKDKVSDVRNEAETAGYNLIHLRSACQWQQVRLDVGIENLLDKGYALPLGGAYLGQGRTMSINGVPWGTAVAGPGRSFYAAVSYSF